MDPKIKDAQSIGFDLDNTLYPKDSRIDNLIRDEVAKKVLEKRLDLLSIEQTKKICEEEYELIGSWTNILKNNHISNPGKIMYQILSNPGVLDLIHKDKKVVSLLEKIKQKYSLFLITSSPRKIALEKLERIGIDTNIFYSSIFGDYPSISTKKDSKIFQEFIKSSPYPPYAHVYIGDNIQTDIINPKLAGMKTIYVGDNKAKEADFSVRGIYEIEKILF